MTGSNREEAVNLASYYFRLIGRKAGENWNSENDAEVEAMIGHAIDAAVEESATRIGTLEERVRVLEQRLAAAPDGSQP